MRACSKLFGYRGKTFFCQNALRTLQEPPFYPGAVIERPRALFPRFMVIWYPTNYVSILPPRIAPPISQDQSLDLRLPCTGTTFINDQSPPQQVHSLFRLNRSRLSSPPSLRLTMTDVTENTAEINDAVFCLAHFKEVVRHIPPYPTSSLIICVC